MAFTDVLTKYLGFLLPEPQHDAFETLFYRNQHLLDCILNSINSENRLVSGSYNSGLGQLEGVQVKFVFGGAVSFVNFPITSVSIVATHQIWCANRVSGTITAINLAEYAQMTITPDDFPILYTGHHNDTHTTTAPFANLIATLNHNTQEKIRLNNPKINEDVELIATATDLNVLNEITVASINTAQTFSNKTISGDNNAIDEVDSVKDFGGIAPNGLKFMLLDIGFWNMDLIALFSIPHSLTYSDIIFIDVAIESDGAYKTIFNSDTGGYTRWDANNIFFQRTTGGFFDSSQFDSTTINRGTVIIWYKA